uniref:NADH-ubiquinone oxidoreductase chain 2 n=1 Tax=Allobathynella sp. JHS-2017 TaxID=2025385 RepID=A0A7R6D8B0_9CRUS|nr:NADH dehydrogenase subunit 2 [Allobathynella sp. JHS-2017]
MFLQGLFLFFILMGIIMIFSSKSWLMIWVGLELTMFSFIPLLGEKSQQVEGAMKYFLAQTMGSLMLIMSTPFLFMESAVFYFLMLALIFKVGAPPLHFWYIDIMYSLNWKQLWFLFTIQKIGPLLSLFYLLESKMNNLFMGFIILSMFTGSMGGLNQKYIKILLGYSSISHTGWALASMIFGYYMFILYFIMYSFILTSLMLIIYYLNLPKSIFHMEWWSLKDSLLFFMNLLSLGGMPPFLGFFMKWMVIESLYKADFYFMSMYFIFMALLTMFYYINLFIYTTMNNIIISKLFDKMKNKMLFKEVLIMTSLNFLPLLFFMFL